VVFKSRLLITAIALPLLTALPVASAGAFELKPDTDDTDYQSYTLDTVKTGSDADGDSIILDGTPDDDSEAGLLVDSDEAVTISGEITIRDRESIADDAATYALDNAIGIKVETALTGNNELRLKSGGQISILEILHPTTDADDDSILEGSQALTGFHQRIGLWVNAEMAAPLIAEAGSSITVYGNGNNSNRVAGVFIDGTLDSNLDLSSSINMFGDDARGVEIGDNVLGYYRQRGNVDVRGENIIGIEIDSSITINGGMMIDANVNATGYSTYFSNPVNGRDESEEDAAINAAERRRGGAAVDIAGDLDGGLIVGGEVNRRITQAERDALGVINDARRDDNNALVDISGGTEQFLPGHFDDNRPTSTSVSLTSYGEDDGDATLKITGDVGLGDGTNFGSIETLLDILNDDGQSTTDIYTRGIVGLKQFHYSHGLMNRGTISANGLYDGFKADAVLLDGDATINGGIYNSGTIEAIAHNQNARALIVDNATLTEGLRGDDSVLLNEGLIAATVNTDAGADATLTDSDYMATAILLTGNSAFSAVGTPTFHNRGSITSSSNYVAADSTRKTNTNIVALNAEGLTSDFNFTQEFLKNDALLDANAVNSSSNPYGGGGDTDIDMNGDGDIDTRDVIALPTIRGDIKFGDGDNIFAIKAGTVSGDISFGGGVDELNLSNEISDDAGDADDADDDYTAPMTGFTGRITKGAGSLGISIDERTQLHLVGQEGVVDDGTESLAVALLTLDGDLKLSIDHEKLSADTPVLDVATLTLGNGSKITPVLVGLPEQPTTVKLISYGNTPTLPTDFLSDETPFIYNVSLTNEDSAISATFERKDANALGLNQTEAAALEAVIAHFSADDSLSAAMTGLMTSEDFAAAYDQLLPHYSDGTAQQLSGLADMATGAVSQHLQIANAGGRRGGDGWLQQFGDYRKQDSSANGQTVSGNNYAISLGYDLPVYAIDALGLYMQIGFSSVSEKSADINEVKSESISYGAYLADTIGPLHYQLNASYGFVDLESERLIDFDGVRLLDIIGRTIANPVIADWEAESTAASARFAYPIFEDSFLLRLEVGVDYFHLKHDDYTESQPLVDKKLAMHVRGGESEKISQFIGLRGGYRAGEGGDGVGIIFEPNYYLGWRTTDDATPYSATAHFVDTPDNSFALKSHIEPEDAVDLGLGFAAHNDYFAFEFNYRARFADDEETHGGGISIRLLF
jgi:hypothetical protein